MGTLTAQLLATLIQANTAAYRSGDVTARQWAAKHLELFAMAERKHVAARVRALLNPPVAVERYEHDADCSCDDCQMERAADTAAECN